MKVKQIFTVIFVVIMLTFVTPTLVNATLESQEESFIVTPLPFWTDDSESIALNYFDDNQTVNFKKTDFRKKVYINGSVGAGTNYQIMINVTYDSKMQSDFDDIRFIDNDGSTPLDFWIEDKIDSSHAIVWIEVLDSLESDEYFYINYGDADSLTTSNGNNTFLFYEDWSGETIDTNKWNVISSAGSVSYDDTDAKHGSVIQINANAGVSEYRIESIYESDTSVSLVGRTKLENTVTTNQRTCFGMGDNNDPAFAWILGINEDEAFYVQDDDANLDSQPMDASYFDTYHVFMFTRDGTNAKLYSEYSLIETASCEPDNNINNVAILYVMDSEYAVYSDWLFARKFIVDEPSFHSFGEEESSISILDVNIPIEQYKNIQISTMIDTINIHSNISLTFKGDLDSNFIVKYCGENSFLYFDALEYDASGYDLLRFYFDFKYSINSYKVIIKDEEINTLTTFQKYTGVYKLNNMFNLYSNNFNESFNIYYIDGNTDYRSDWKREIDNQDSNVQQYDFSAYVASTEDISHYSQRSLFVSGFQFYRAEMNFYSSAEDYDYALGDRVDIIQRINFTFYYPNGTKLYKVVFFINCTSGPSWQRYHADVYVYKNDIKIWNCPYSEIMIPLLVDYNLIISKVAVWRTQENYLAVKVNGDMNYALGNNKFNWTYWYSQEKIINYQCLITFEYSINTLQIDEYIASLDNSVVEYYYNALDGCVEPHFSTTWWDNIPIIGPIINGFIWVGHLIINGLSTGFSIIIAGAVGLFTPLFNIIVSAIGAIAGSIWGLFAGVLTAIQDAIGAIAGSIWGFFSAIIGSILTAIEDIIANMVIWIVDGIEAFMPILLDWLNALLEGLGGLLVDFANFIGGLFGIVELGTILANAIASFVLSIGTLLSFIAGIVESGISILSVISYYLIKYLPSALALIGLMAVMDISMALVSGDETKIANSIGRYTNIAEKAFEILGWIAELVIGFIGGIIP